MTLLNVKIMLAVIQFIKKYPYYIFDRSLSSYDFIMKSTKIIQKPRLLKIYQSEALCTAKECLKAGEIIALPTDTVYGLACDVSNEMAIQRLYKIKKRDVHKPIAICVRNHSAIRKYGQTNHLGDSLLRDLLPGPITIIVERSNLLPKKYFNPGTNKIGIRIPESTYLQQLLTLCENEAIALTSANESTEPSSLNIKEFEKLWPLLGCILDGGQIGSSDQRLASTIIDLSEPGFYETIRNGMALEETLQILHSHGLQKRHMDS